MPAPSSSRALLPLFALSCAVACGEAPVPSSVALHSEPAPSAPAPSAEPVAPRGTSIAAHAFGDATLALYREPDGVGVLWLAARGESPQLVPCDRLEGAWGLWVDDVDLDGHPEAIVGLRKPARFDPKVDNRLHVYGIEQGRCVPAWRGTRLAGRFDALATDAAAPGTILVSERLGRSRRRVARYRWNGFGYTVSDVLWQGDDRPPTSLTRDLVVAPTDPS